MDAKKYNLHSSAKEINHFFDQHNLAESKALLWKLLSTAACGNFSGLPATEKENLFGFYNHLMELLESLNPEKEEGPAND